MRRLFTRPTLRQRVLEHAAFGAAMIIASCILALALAELICELTGAGAL